MNSLWSIWYVAQIEAPHISLKSHGINFIIHQSPLNLELGLCHESPGTARSKPSARKLPDTMMTLSAHCFGSSRAENRGFP
ncbi:hypothetical protein J1614_007531 [Plenodomus biglobosus]|nr:hypothetical protein J1614_007531 [Plenodomus biglobosus]